MITRILIISLLQILYINADTIRYNPILPSESRPINNKHISISERPRIKYESYKALAGETVRLECPQPNPTWFFRSRKNSNDAKNSNTGEDLIVTRHGIINAGYKYKIMCHVTLKHKVIIINKIDFEDEGLYTCLYSKPSNMYYGGVKRFMNNENLNMLQYRYVFNVTVYTLINGLTMDINHLSNGNSLNYFPGAKTMKVDSETTNQEFAVIDNTLTIKENEELSLKCVVDSSKPAADIRFITTYTNKKNTQSLVRHSSLSSHINRRSNETENLSELNSLITSKTEIIQNNDFTYKTVFTARLRAKAKDHGKIITCKADNGFSNQKWENKKSLNILFKPVCQDPSNYTYYVGINQTLNVECRILKANPSAIKFKWNVNGINGNLHTKSSIMNNNVLINSNMMNNPMNSGSMFPSGRISNHHVGILKNYQGSFMPNRIEAPRILGGFIDTELGSSFKFQPQNMNDFGKVYCTATNEIGSTECSYNIKLGGVPNPPSECSYNLKNTSAIISCQVGFHQGDPNIYCYLLRKSDNGVYKEHTRNRESCSFIVNDVDLKKFNEFWIYSSNKHGHNKEMGVHLTIGEAVKVPENNNNKMITIIAVAAGICVILLLACCFSFKIRKGFSEDNDSIFESDAYQTKYGNANSLVSNQKTNQKSAYPAKLIKGVKVTSKDSSYDINNHIKDSKLLIDEKPKKNYDLNDSKTKKYSIFKTTQFPSTKYDNKKNRVESLYSNKFDNQTGILNKASNNIYQNRVKKSISFTKPLHSDTTEFDKVKESTPLYNHPENNFNEIPSGLLTTVTNHNSTLYSDPNRMVTFGNSNLYKQHNDQMHTSGLNSISSTNGSNTSPATSSTNNDSDFASSSTVHLQNSLDLEHQNYSTIKSKENNLSIDSLRPSPCHKNSEKSMDNMPNQYTNHSNSNKKSKSVDKNHALAPLHHHKNNPNQFQKNITTSNSRSNTTFSSDILETKFLNKLCEDIEVSLNVDCECADDYSSNDFSGDYSFDNFDNKMALSATVSKGSSQRIKNAQIVKLNPIKNKIDNLDQNIKKIRNNNVPDMNRLDQVKNNFDQNNSQNNQIGVLV